LRINYWKKLFKKWNKRMNRQKKLMQKKQAKVQCLKKAMMKKQVRSNNKIRVQIKLKANRMAAQLGFVNTNLTHTVRICIILNNVVLHVLEKIQMLDILG